MRGTRKRRAATNGGIRPLWCAGRGIGTQVDGSPTAIAWDPWSAHAGGRQEATRNVKKDVAGSSAIGCARAMAERAMRWFEQEFAMPRPSIPSSRAAFGASLGRARNVETTIWMGTDHARVQKTDAAGER